MADDLKKFDFTKAINQLEEINTWFQNEDFNLDEGLLKLKQGKELIKKCRTRLREVENEFGHIKQEFSEEAQGDETDALDTLSDGHHSANNKAGAETLGEEDTPF